MFKIILGLLTLGSLCLYGQSPKPFRIGVAGLTHDHVHGILSRAHDGDIEIVGIAEPNRDLALRYIERYKLPTTILFSSLEEMLEKSKPEAVTAFNSILGHLEVVKACAPRKIHVMVEKPLAVSMEHAREMEALAEKHGILLLTNYETTWYGSSYKFPETLTELGDIRKIVVHDGHPGPKEIGVSKEFLEWLTDPVQNGGGAIIDFGCYGANLMTWIMHGTKPQSVFAVTQQIKPDIYPNVDDEATIVLTYPKAQGIIQASWNWTFSRKDMEVYGLKAYAKADRNGITLRTSANGPEELIAMPPPPTPYHDAFAYFASAARGMIKVQDTDLSALPNNMTVVEILEAARTSAKTGRIVYLK